MLAENINDAVGKVLSELAASGGFRSYAGAYSQRLAERLSEAHAGAEVLLTSSGTAALEIALRAAGIGHGDEVLLSAYDYPGNFWAIERSGARPLLLDVEPESWRVSREQLDAALRADSARGIKGLIVSHLHGSLQRVAELRQCCDRHGMVLFEDNCQSLGAEIGGRPSGTYGHFSIASFGGGKVLSAGRGGSLFTADAGLMQKARLAAGSGSGPYALSEIQAAVVCAQLPWLSSLNRRCRDYFAQLDGILQQGSSGHGFPARYELGGAAIYQSGWLMPADIAKRITDARERLVGDLKQRGIAAGGGFAGFHRRSARRCRMVGDLTQSANVVTRTWVLHHSQALTGNRSSQEVADEIIAATSAL